MRKATSPPESKSPTGAGASSLSHLLAVLQLSASDSASLLARGPRGSAHDQLRFQNDWPAHTLLLCPISCDPPEYCLCCKISHFPQRLLHAGKARVLVGGAFNVIKANDGYIFRNTQSEFM
jgi:hypothetical protein